MRCPPRASGQIIAVGTQAKGLYVSVDGGTKYKPRHSRLPRPVGRGSKTSITGAALDPSNSDVGWAGTEVDGIYRLERKKFFPPENGTAVRLKSRVLHVLIAVDPNSTSTVYGLIPTEINSVRMDNRLYRSHDGGHTWPEVAAVAEESDVSALYFRSGSSSTLFARDRTALLGFEIDALTWVDTPLPDPLDPRSGGPRTPTVFDRGEITVIVDDGSIMRTKRKDDGSADCGRPEDAHANDDVDWAAIGAAFYGPESARRVVPRLELLTVFPSHAWLGRNDPECNFPIVNTSGGAGAYNLPVSNLQLASVSPCSPIPTQPASPLPCWGC